MSLIEKIMECREEEVDLIIKQAIFLANQNSNPVEKLGFLEFGNANSFFKGFIPLKTRIKYANYNLEDYSMETTDFIYEFAHFLKKYHISNKGSLIYNMEYFINSYFGFPGKIDRETIFNQIAWQTTTTDEEYFAALENNKIGDLKGTGSAQCTERAAVAQQLLSIFGTPSYYCMGCVERSGKQEAHSFNIVEKANGYALLDYSIPVSAYDESGNVIAYYPFVGILTNEEFDDFINNGTIKAFDDYYLTKSIQKKTNNKRKYVIGKFTIDREIEMSNV